MIRIGQLKLPVNHTEDDILLKASKTLRISKEVIETCKIVKQSIDARKKSEVQYVYTVDIVLNDNRIKEDLLVKKCKQASLVMPAKEQYHFPKKNEAGPDNSNPIIVGSGPAGLFCGYMLATNGYHPIIIERGAPVEERIEDVTNFWNTGHLNKESNVQFGEGGAGTFSDGKLNTLVKDKYGRNRKVLEVFVEHGAPESILYESKPHIGTDILSGVIKNMRQTILSHGGQILFHTKLTDIILEDGVLTGIEVNKERKIYTDTLVLALGHSARDTFEMLYERKLPMEAKSFAVGVRVEHLQEMINAAQYGETYATQLPAAPYKLTTQLDNGRGVYTFCMCPGGYVVNSSSEEGRLAVNGMSYHDRAGVNANSAVIVTVTPDDFESGHPLAGIAFQRQLEEQAYQAGNGKIPVQRLEDYCNHCLTKKLGAIAPEAKGAYQSADVRSIFPKEIGDSIALAMNKFDKKIPGFANADVLLSGVESRTSSPIRMTRNDRLESTVSGIYPCGEGAGYAGGITSAAMDGIKVAEMIAEKE